MNSENEVELAVGTQGSEGRSEPVGQQMQGDSPPRTMRGLTLGAYIGGNAQYGLSAGLLTPPGLRLTGPWSSTRGNRLTDNLYSQISQENFNGTQERSVEGGSPSGEEDGENKEAREGHFEDDTQHEENRNSYTTQVLSRLSVDQITRVTATLIVYVSNDVTLEKWMNVEPEGVVSIAQRLLKKLTGAGAEEMTFTRSYEGARYELDECTDFSQEHRVPSGVKDPFGRFTVRRVRRWFDSTNPKERHKMTASEEVVVKYNKQAATFRIKYQVFELKMDVEDVDMTTFEDILVMGPKYGDHRAEWGKTRDECRRATVYAVILQESWEEIVHNNVPIGHGVEESELGGAACYTAAEDQPVIFDDEPRNPSELSKHPEREAILVSAGKEIDQLIEMEIGVEVTPSESKQVTEKGLRILQCKMVYKRKYTIGENGKERFLKWKSRIAVVGSSEREGWETGYITFLPTVVFSVIRLLISLTVDPKFSVE